MLVLISILAASGLIWASIATAKHVKRTRKRQVEIGAATADYCNEPRSQAVSPSDANVQRTAETTELEAATPTDTASVTAPPSTRKPQSLVQAWAAMGREHANHSADDLRSSESNKQQSAVS